MHKQTQIKECIYQVRGTHCASCEVLIERKLLEVPGIKAVEADASKGRVLIEYEYQKPDLQKLNQLFKGDKYIFSEVNSRPDNSDAGYTININLGNALKILVISGLIIAIFWMLNRSGFSGLVNVSKTSSLPAFFVFGLLAGISTCAALIGGIILSMSKQWSEIYGQKDSSNKKFEPHLMFNIGRVLSYFILGSLLGVLGSKLQFSVTWSAYFAIIISIIMLFLGLQMLGLRSLRRFQITAPKSVTRYIANEKNFKGRYMPSLMGAATFFLPCGFTITAQGLALLSGSPLRGGLIMLFFALGTAPILLAIGLSSVKFNSRPHLSAQFLKIAGLIVLFFALYNFNAQMTVLGFTGFKRGSPASQTNQIDGLAPIVNGKQVLKMQASSRGYSPNYFKIKSGVPARFEITDTGTSGCTNAVISKLFNGRVDLTPGTTSIKEFTPQKPGRYVFSCWMGMISGIIEVIDPTTTLNTNINTANAAEEIPSGAKGCGCSGGGKGSCGGN